MPPNPQRRNRHTHTAILDATIEVLTRVGYRRMTIEAIAAQAGVGKATVYRWWPTKAQLALEALNRHTHIEPVITTGNLHRDVRALLQQVADLLDGTLLGHVFPPLAADLAHDPHAKAKLNELLPAAHTLHLASPHLASLHKTTDRATTRPDLDATLLLDVIAGTIIYRNLLGQPVDNKLLDQLSALLTR